MMEAWVDYLDGIKDWAGTETRPDYAAKPVVIHALQSHDSPLP